ncbi:MAG: PKD domain-containing protein [Bacteroidales bacterium]|nr:PKD domain-containing protein [Bacteroidales bacterium]
MKTSMLMLALVLLSMVLPAQNYVSTEPMDKNAILEEFTGVSCPNCPAGHQVAANILANNPGRAFMVAYHPSNSSYTTPFPGDPDFRRDYPAAFYSTPYCGSSRFMPSAFIARRLWANGERIQSRPVWETYCNTIMSEPSPANMGISTSYDLGSQTIYITVEIYYTENMTDDNHIYVLLSENDLVSQQSGATGPYTHKHTFREAFVDQWGDLITEPTTQGNLVTLEYSWNAAGSGYIISNCEVLAFIENQANGEIITGVGVHVGESTYIEPTAGFTVDDNTVGVGNEAIFTDESTGNPTSWEWTFEGGDPASSTLQSPPPVTYNSPGQYGVTLTVTNPAGTNTTSMSNFMDIGYAPEAEFSASQTLLITGESIDFTDNSSNEPTSWFWEFEGGTPATSDEQNPAGIAYNTPGDYNVTLMATNDYGETTITKESYIHVGDVGINEQFTARDFRLYPNPTRGKLFVASGGSVAIEQISILNLHGQVVYISNAASSYLQVLDLNNLENGIYFVEIRSKDKVYLEKVLLN